MVGARAAERRWKKRGNCRRSRDMFVHGALHSVSDTVSVASCAALCIAEVEAAQPLCAYKVKVAGSRVINRFESPWIGTYIADPTVYPADHFRTRFRILRILFSTLRRDLMNFNYDVWRIRVDAARKDSIRSEVKILPCHRILGSRRSFDDVDRSTLMGLQTITSYFFSFFPGIISVHVSTYLNVRLTAHRCGVLRRSMLPLVSLAASQRNQ